MLFKNNSFQVVSQEREKERSNYQVLPEHKEWCSLLSHSWWDPLIKFMMRSVINVREGNTISLYFGLSKNFLRERQIDRDILYLSQHFSLSLFSNMWLFHTLMTQSIRHLLRQACLVFHIQTLSGLLQLNIFMKPVVVLVKIAR